MSLREAQRLCNLDGSRAPGWVCFAPRAMTKGGSMSYYAVFDPCGVVEAEAVALAPRIADLNRLRLGVLDNTKWNANRLLRKMTARLGEQVSLAAVNYYRKESFSKDADPALIDRIAAENEIVLTAIGD
jgi:hypothetical protein